MHFYSFIRMFVVALLLVFLGPYLAILAIVVLLALVGTVAAIFICCHRRHHKKHKALEHLQLDILAM